LSHVVGSAPTAGRNERAEMLSLGGTAHEQVLLTQEITVLAESDGWMVLVPVTERGDAIGLLEVSLATKPAPEVVAYLVAAGHALAYVLIAVRRHTDLFEWAQRDAPFSVSAEIQRRLLPSAYTAEAGVVTLAGWLEPSHTAGGDTFDYSLEREYLYLSLTDAMGHSTQAALLATLAVATLRNRRRVLATPAEQAEAVDAELRANATAEQFVTGLVARMRLADGAVEIVNAGHPAPYVVRAGQARALELSVQPPLGAGPGEYRADTIALQTGDRMVMVTDGYLERRAALVDIEAILAAGAELHPRQVVQRLARAVLAATGGRLRDDATVLCVDFYGPAGRRDATAGASQARVTQP
jgi:serine phosphatase RsbU (regulator of sigma subunit)